MQAVVLWVLRTSRGVVWHGTGVVPTDVIARSFQFLAWFLRWESFAIQNWGSVVQLPAANCFIRRGPVLNTDTRPSHPIGSLF